MDWGQGQREHGSLHSIGIDFILLHKVHCVTSSPPLEGTKRKLGHLSFFLDDKEEVETQIHETLEWALTFSGDVIHYTAMHVMVPFSDTY